MHVHWYEGLFLQPHHLQVMQHELLNEVRALRKLVTPFHYGVLESELLPDNLRAGEVKFRRLHAIMPDGQEVRYPGEVAGELELNIKDDLARGGGTLEVWLVTPKWSSSGPNSFREDEYAQNQIGKRLYIPHLLPEVPDENSGSNQKPLHVRKINARLVLKNSDMSEMEKLPVLRVVRAGPREDIQFIPPCLRVAASAVLKTMVEGMVGQMRGSRDDLQARMKAGGMTSDLRWECLLRLRTLNHFCGRLEPLLHLGQVPPFEVHLLLRELLGELQGLLAEGGGNLREDDLRYIHEDSFESFRVLCQEIRTRIKMVETKAREIRFTGDAASGHLALEATLQPDDLKGDAECYLGVTTSLDRRPVLEYLRDGQRFKLMPPSYANVAIPGIVLDEITGVPAGLRAENNLHYLRIRPKSDPELWKAITEEKAMVLRWNNAAYDLTQASFSLYIPQ